MMFQPSHIDGRTLVVLRVHSGFFATRFEVVANGLLEFDGDALELVDVAGTRLATSDEMRERIKSVTRTNRIAECLGFDLFLILDF